MIMKMKMKIKMNMIMVMDGDNVGHGNYGPMVISLERIDTIGKIRQYIMDNP